MDPQPGIVIRALPRFSDGTLDYITIEANSGVMVKNGSLWPKGDWRPLTEHEAEILGLRGKAAGSTLKRDPSENPDTLWIFAIPLHLLQHWQRIREPFAPDTGGGSLVQEGPYRGFVSQVVDFFRFKAVPLPDKCKFEMVSNFPEIGPTEIPSELEGDFRASVQVPLLVSEDVQVAANLGGATSSLIFVNLSIGQMELILGERPDPASGSARGTAERFFSRFPEYPCFRISLPPRMGYVLGGLATVQVRCPLSRADPDFWLCVSAVTD